MATAQAVSAFERAFARTVGHEGGEVNDPRDPGGHTKFGISQRAYPAEDIANLTLERARLLYRRDYWNRVRGDYLPEAVAMEAFDAAVNHGVMPAVRMMQRALGVDDDGIIGPITLQAAQDIEPAVFVARFNGWRLFYYTSLKTWPHFGKGWARRVAQNLLEVK
ncbi:MAG: glycoside hydrolase family 108 protein [Anaerolineae bacterium]|nr:glycoside hydrolase family 108 protein [Anaerolineae bacterium]